MRIVRHSCYAPASELIGLLSDELAVVPVDIPPAEDLLGGFSRQMMISAARRLFPHERGPVFLRKWPERSLNRLASC